MLLIPSSVVMSGYGGQGQPLNRTWFPPVPRVSTQTTNIYQDDSHAYTRTSLESAPASNAGRYHNAGSREIWSPQHDELREKEIAVGHK